MSTEATQNSRKATTREMFMPSNGEVEGPGTHARQGRRARNIDWVPPAQTAGASRPPPTIVRGRKHRSTVPVATVLRKPKQPQETSRALVRARNPQRRPELLTDQKPPTSSEAAAAMERNHKRQEDCRVATARARTGESVDRRVFGL